MIELDKSAGYNPTRRIFITTGLLFLSNLALPQFVTGEPMSALAKTLTLAPRDMSKDIVDPGWTRESIRLIDRKSTRLNSSHRL